MGKHGGVIDLGRRAALGAVLEREREREHGALVVLDGLPEATLVILH